MNRLSCASPRATARALLRLARAGGLLFMLHAATVREAPATETASDSKTNDLTALPLEALMNLEVPKVYAASRVEQKTTEAPASITLINAEEIKKFGYRTLGDVLESAQGFNVSSDRNYAFVGVSGVNLGDFNSRILLLVDGHRVNENLTDGAYVDTSFILDLDLVDRVEIIRGPGSALYGNNAFFGVINVVTRQAAQIQGVESSFEYGAFDTYKGRVTFGERFTNGLSLLLSGTIFDSAGESRLFYKEFNTPPQNNGIAQDMDADRYHSIFASLGYGDLTWETAFNHREKVNPTAQFSLTTFDDPRLRTVDERGYTALKYANSFPGVVDVTAQIYGDTYSHNIGFPQSAIVANKVVFSSFTPEQDAGEWCGAELQLNKTIMDRHVLTFGGEFRDDFLQEASVGGQTPLERTRESYGVYLQGDFALRDNLHLEAGARYDQYGDFAPAFDPRVALIYNPVKESTIKMIYGTAFRAPNFSELIDPRFQEITPETITSYDLVYEQEWGRHLRSSLRGFYNQMDHLIVFNNGTFTNMNANTKGAEAALEGSWADGFRARASYSFQDTRNDTVSWQTPNSPDHMFKLNLAVPLWADKLSLGMELLYTTSRRSLHNTTDASGEPIIVQGETVGAYGLVNLTLFSQKLVKNLEMSASVYNLLDSRYDDPASQFHVQDAIEQQGRSFRLKLTYRF
ncbi:MAG TPA: TonB-dependent receptor [Verrucomicrobiae bacterium]|jgi:iron complex outermembrane receptor protein|nr:TonB-dependent receptor [Verrucomicrobiae bacterium]